MQPSIPATPLIPETLVRAKNVYEGVKQLICLLFDRYQEEGRYSACLFEYKTRIAFAVQKINPAVTVTAMTCDPFGFTFVVDGATFHVTMRRRMGTTEYAYRRVLSTFNRREVK